MRSMKIILYNDFEKIIGGTEVYQRTLADSLKIRGHEVLEIFGTSDSFPETISEFKKMVFLNSNKINSVLRDSLIKKIQTFQPDIIHVNNNKIFTKTILDTFYSQKIPILSAFHDFHFFYKKMHVFNPKRYWKRSQFRMVEAYSSGLFSLTKVIERELREHSEKNIYYLPLFLDADIWKFKGDCHLNEARIVFFGRIEETKGIFVLKEAFDLIRKQIPECELLYIGDGTDKEKLTTLIEKDASGKISYLGRLPQSELLAQLHQSRVAVVPTITEEPFGLTGIEAQSAGLPVVASHVGGIPEWCRHGETGLLVPPADSEELALALLKLLKDSELSKNLSTKAKQNCVENYDKDQIIGRTIEMYETVIRKFRAGRKP